MDSPSPHSPSPHHSHEPQRLSALYQYHNAPEVAPAHGLEYDDTIYPSSDKYPVIREHAYGDAKYGFGGDNRPPRIIFGMKVRTFLIVAAVMSVIVIGAAVGGAVGGQQLRNQAQQQFAANQTSNNATATSSGTASTSTFAAATPTYAPLSDCPESNNTGYTSSFSKTIKFTKYCDLSSPLTLPNSASIAEAFVYSFSDCVEVCAGYNHYNSNGNCTVAVYKPAGDRPGNCVVGYAGSIKASQLNSTSGTDVAILDA